MRLGDTIVATIGGEGSPRGIVRVSGPGAFVAAGVPRQAGVSSIRVPFGVCELPAIAIAFVAPRSFSGEDGVELLLPGNRELLRRVAAKLCERPEVRPALPGEFTARAFINGKLTPEQAEGVGALIAARSDAEHTAAERLLSGAAGEEYRAIADEIASALALLEAGIDFTDQDDVVAISETALRERVERVIGSIDRLLGPGAREVRSELALVVLAGAPNAGKSTLFNALLRRERAVVSEVAGTTRDVIVEELDLVQAGWVPGTGFGATRLQLADLAGLDRAIVGVSHAEAGAQRAARDAIERADVVVWCDPTGRFELGHEMSLARGTSLLRVRTKGDLAVGEDAGGAIRVCAIDGWHLGALVRAIQDAIERSTTKAGTALIPRHRLAMQRCRASLEEAIGQLGTGAGSPAAAEVIATCLRDALDQVGSIAGQISPDDVIGRIFATFCIGK